MSTTRSINWEGTGVDTKLVISNVESGLQLKNSNFLVNDGSKDVVGFVRNGNITGTKTILDTTLSNSYPSSTSGSPYKNILDFLVNDDGTIKYGIETTPGTSGSDYKTLEDIPEYVNNCLISADAVVMIINQVVEKLNKNFVTKNDMKTELNNYLSTNSTRTPFGSS